jgi:16S rRNA (cytidine1402-2'-O)-methyltransferase
MGGPTHDGGILYVVATPIGNLEDITLRALRVLREASVIAAENTRTVRHLLEHHGIAGATIVSCFEGNEAAGADELLVRVRAGERVALVSEAGTPGISDPGARVIAVARAAGLRVEVIPGAAAVVAALVGSGLPTERFLVLGCPPRAEGARHSLFGGLRAEPGTLVLYEAPGRVGQTLADLAAALGGERRAELARELTKLFEERVAGTLAELVVRYADTPPRGECVVLVAGASTGAATPDSIDVEAEIRARLHRGEGCKEIAAALALLTGRRRRDLYQLALALRGSGL